MPLVTNFILSFVRLRSNHWSTPEALFEIVRAGGKIPPMFKLLRSNENFIHEGPWIGVALCAVITLGNIDACMEAKYVVTVHIHVNKKHWSISIPVKFVTAGLENQLVLYWTIADEVEGTLNSRQEKWRLWRFSFKVELGDSNLQLTRFGVLIICKEDILQLTRHEDSTCQVVKELIQAALFLPTDLQWYIRACEANTELPAGFRLNIHGLTSRMTKFIDDYRQQQYYSLNDIHEFLKCLFESNRRVLSEWKKEWRHSKLFPLVYEYYRICQGTSELYNDFVFLLKAISSSWLSVKLALEQIVARIRAGNYTREVMLEHLNVLEAAKGVRFSPNFVMLFAYICKQTVEFSRRLNIRLQGMKKLKSLELMAKASSIEILVVLNFAATVMGHNELLEETKDITSYSEWLQKLKQSLSRKPGRWLILEKQQIKGSFRRDLYISDFYSNAHLLRELKSRVARSNHVINEDEEELLVVIDELEKKINSCSLTIEDMGSNAHNYSLEIRKAGMRLHEFVEAGKYPPVTRFGVRFIHASKRDEDYASEVKKTPWRTITSLQGDLPWYVCDCGADTGLHSCRSIIHDHTSSQIRFFIDYRRQQDILDGFHNIFECLRANTFSIYAFQFYVQLTGLLKDVSDSWLRAKLALEQIVVKSRTEEHTYNEIIVRLHVADNVSYSQLLTDLSIGSLFRAIIYNYSTMLKDVGEIQRELIIGVLGVMATYVGDSGLMEELKDITSESMLFDLIQRISKLDGEWFDDRGMLKRRSNDGELQIWDSHGNVLLGELKKKMVVYHCFNQKIKEEMLMVIDKLNWNISAFSGTIQELHKHAQRIDQSLGTRTTVPWKARLKKVICKN